ncbi:AraC family transcriptional regulator [Paenibacillus beijingensis]|uniref:AraC family transcriptional regulator n=1 Tax=Paenibacillus beijingensis TaxID=1126833 RepID=UPI0006980174|nr:helix-turn-helix domain-containing protein [Paenibacillus beijingensis]
MKERLCSVFGTLRQAQYCAAAYIRLEQTSEARRQPSRTSANAAFISACNRTLSASGQGIALRHWNDASFVLLYMWSESANLHSHLKQFALETAHSLQATPSIGISSACSFPKHLRKCGVEAHQALNGINLLHRTANAAVYDEDALPAAVRLHFYDFEDDFRIALLSGSELSVRETVGRWFDEMRKLPGISLGQLEIWNSEIRLMLLRWTEKYGIKDGADIRYELEEAIAAVPFDEQGFFSIEAWQRNLGEIVLSIIKQLNVNEVRSKSIVYEMARYIDHNYNDDLSVQEIAKHFHLSREYASRLFKKETGENLNDYIQKIHMTKAQQLLAGGTLKINEIAQMIGYNDEKYFSKVFKKQFGVSPNRFRKLPPT